MRLPRVAVTIGDPAGIGPEVAAKAAASPRVLEVCTPVIYGRIYTPGVQTGVLSAEAGRAAYAAIRAAFHADALRVVLATIHEPLAAVPRLLTREVVEGVIRLTARELPRFGFAAPRLAVCGLNPHAGEGGVLGDEEQRIIGPAIAACAADRIDVQGPFPADTLFVRASRGAFDAVVACYHDQGLIPVKLLAFGTSVNVTLGLPIIRTSVDHGTAFDIAGRNAADPGSMIAAVRLAATLAAGRIADRAGAAGTTP